MKVTIPDAVFVTGREGRSVVVHPQTHDELPLEPGQVLVWKALAETPDVYAARARMRKQSGMPETVFEIHFQALMAEALPRGLMQLDGAVDGLLGAWAPGPFQGTRPAVWLGRTARELRERLGWWLDSRFDRRYGTDTSGLVFQDRLRLEGAAAQDAVYYEATPTSVLRRALDTGVPDPDGYVLVDYGSGKGRVLLVASDYPFRRVIGVELSGLLHLTAQHNLRLYRRGRHRCADVRSVCADAADFALPEDDLVLYFYTPFVRQVFARVLENIRASFARRPRRLIIITYSSRQDHVDELAALPMIRQRREIALRYELSRVEQRRLYVFTS